MRRRHDKTCRTYRSPSYNRVAGPSDKERENPRFRPVNVPYCNGSLIISAAVGWLAQRW